MSFPVNPKNGLIYKHKNGLTYVYVERAKTWDIVHDDMTPIIGAPTPAPRKKPRRALNSAPPTINTNAKNMGVINELS